MLISTYNMISFGGRRSKEALEIMGEIEKREWGLLVLDEVSAQQQQLPRPQQLTATTDHHNNSSGAFSCLMRSRHNNNSSLPQQLTTTTTHTRSTWSPPRPSLRARHALSRGASSALLRR